MAHSDWSEEEIRLEEVMSSHNQENVLQEAAQQVLDWFGDAPLDAEEVPYAMRAIEHVVGFALERWDQVPYMPRFRRLFLEWGLECSALVETERVRLEAFLAGYDGADALSRRMSHILALTSLTDEDLKEANVRYLNYVLHGEPHKRHCWVALLAAQALWDYYCDDHGGLGHYFFFPKGDAMLEVWNYWGADEHGMMDFVRREEAFMTGQSPMAYTTLQ